MTSRISKLAQWIAVAILGFSLVACGGGDDDNGSASGTGASTGSSTGASPGASNGNDGGEGVWEGELETGTKVELTMWVDPSDPALAEFEAFREAAGANPVMYAKVVATNDGTVPDTSRFVTLTDEDGEMFDGTAVELNFLCSHIGRWIAVVATQTTELVNEYNALLTEQCNGNTLAGPAIAAGESVTYYVAYEGETEPEFERVFMGLGNELKR